MGPRACPTHSSQHHLPFFLSCLRNALLALGSWAPSGLQDIHNSDLLGAPARCCRKRQPTAVWGKSPSPAQGSALGLEQPAHLGLCPALCHAPGPLRPPGGRGRWMGVPWAAPGAWPPVSSRAVCVCRTPSQSPQSRDFTEFLRGCPGVVLKSINRREEIHSFCF